MAHMSSKTEHLNIVLLTSVEHKRFDIPKRLERRFYKGVNKIKKLDTEVTTKVIHGADQEDLYNALTDQKIDAVFWVSHASFISSNSSSSSMSPQSMILDINSDNVAPIFQVIHPNMKFIGIIGCNTQSILDEYLDEDQEDSISKDSNLRYISKRRSIAQFALSRALRKFKKAIKYNLLPTEKNKESTSGFDIEVKRTMQSHIPHNEIRSIRVLSQGRVVGLIPKILPGESEIIKLKIPYNKDHNYKLELSTGQNIYTDSEKIHFGDLEVFNEKNSWEVFAKRDGTPFGINTIVYIPH